MESSHKPGNLTCCEVRESLSDLIDVRRGELPHPDGTLLSESGRRAAVELHLAGCEGCREEMFVLEETGAAFADFSVGEMPAQHFADYGQKVRARMAQSSTPVKLPVASRSPIFVRFALSSLAAASVVLAITFGLNQKAVQPTASSNENAKGTDAIAELETKSGVQLPSVPDRVKSDTVAETTPRILSAQPRSPGSRAETVSIDVMHPKRNMRVYDPAKHALSGLQKDEGELGYLIFAEKTAAGQRPLLGVYLRTTREVDRSVDEKLGLLVLDVVRGSPAHVMGLMPGDYIVTLDVNNTELAINDGGSEDAVKLLTAIHEGGKGARIKLQVVRPEGSQHQFRMPSGVLGEY